MPGVNFIHRPAWYRKSSWQAISFLMFVVLIAMIWLGKIFLFSHSTKILPGILSDASLKNIFVQAIFIEDKKRWAILSADHHSSYRLREGDYVSRAHCLVLSVQSEGVSFRCGQHEQKKLMTRWP